MDSRNYEHTLPRDGLFIGLGLSLLLHLLLLPIAPRFLTLDSYEKVESDEPVTFMLDDMKDSQVVDLNNQDESLTPPEDSPYLSDLNRRVDKQTQARDTSPQVPAQAEKQQASRESTQELDIKESAEGAISSQQPDTKLDTDLPQDWLASLTPANPTNYLPDLEIGNETLLNTREYAYSQFYNRMKRQMELVWNPRRVLQNASRDFRKQYLTILDIVLTKSGEVKSVKLISSSTIDALDQEAVRAVYKAAPYLNPPDGLLDADGTIKINGWGFIIHQGRALF